MIDINFNALKIFVSPYLYKFQLVDIIVFYKCSITLWINFVIDIYLEDLELESVGKKRNVSLNTVTLKTRK